MRQGDIMRIRQPFIILFILAMLAACSSAATTTPTPTALALSQSITSANGTVTLSYPTGWAASAESVVIKVGNTTDVLNAPAPAAGQFQMRIATGPIDALPDVPADATARNILNHFIKGISSSALTLGAANDITIGSHSAARVDVTAKDGQGTIIALNLGAGVYALVSANTAPGELAKFEPTMNAIIDSIRYTAPETTPGT
jgi:hypothetical protein